MIGSDNLKNKTKDELFDKLCQELKHKSKDELLEFLYNCIEKKSFDNTKVHEINALDKLREYSSLHSQIDKINNSSKNVSITMFRIFNLENIGDIIKGYKANKILNDISKLLKSKIRNTDILIKYKEQNFVIIASNTDIVGMNKYAHKLNQIIVSNIFGSIGHLHSNFSTTMFKEDDDINSIINRLYDALIDIEKNSTKNFIEV